jgi:energy-coupling factor transporter ATP-binding protein EcfA2
MIENQNIDTYLIKYNVSQQSIKTIKDSLNNNESRKIIIEHDLKKLEQVHELLTKLKQFKMDSKKEFILKTINTALKDIFGEDIRIDIEAMSNLENGKINMKYDIILFQNDIEIARNEKLIESNGGGVLSVISILFKMLVGFIYSENKFYMFDESLSQVSADYRPRLSKFLQEFCTVHGFTIILVSHTEELDIHADLVYSLSGSFDKEGIPVLHIQETLGNYPLDNYIYTKIKNFQSIVDLEFRFKGFTIIRGSNNIGKSATLRAINSVIFNDFDKNMQRITNARSIETSIEFGYHHLKEDGTLDESKKIRVSYKSQKVNYEFDGMIFAGKNLAFDKVQEKIESIGFKYINLKDAYKNFKGNLKDQTERLSLTTQHDGLFLVGSKNTDSSKIFDFLFDSYLVALAIAKVKNDINSFLMEFNDINLKNSELNKQLKIEEIKERYFSLQYYNLLIAKNIELHNTINKIDYKNNIVIQILNKMNNIILINNTNNIIYNIYSKLKIINNNTIMKQIENITKIVFNLKHHLLIQKNITWLHQYKDICQKLIPLEKALVNIERIIFNKKWLLYIMDFNKKTNDLLIIKSNEDNLKNRIQKITSILEKYSFLKILQNYNTFIYNLNNNQSLNMVNSLNQKIETIKNIITRLHSKLNLEKYIQSINENIIYINQNIFKQTELYNSILTTTNILNNLENEFGLEKCKYCNGIGYNHKH